MNILKDELTPKERKILYNQGKEVDRIPCSLGISEASAVYYGIDLRKYYFSADLMKDVAVKIAREVGIDNTGLGLGLKGIGEALGSVLRYPKDGISFVSSPVLTDYKDFDSLEIINPYKDGRIPIILEALKMLVEELSEERVVGTNIAGPLSTAASIRGTENLLKDMIKNKSQLHKLLEFSVECNLKYVEIAYKECGVKPSIADPVASANLISLKQFKEFGKPYLIKLIDGIEKITGSKPSLHVCGYTKDRWLDLYETGIKGFSVDNCEDLSELKDILGDKIGIAGNVPPMEVMKNGTVEDVKNSVKICLEKGSDSPKGFTLAGGCQLPIGTPRENIYAFMEATRYYGRNAVKGSLPKGLK